jgi:hypothetical protein
MQRLHLSRIPWLFSFFIGTPAVLVLAFVTLQRLESFRSITTPKVLAATSEIPSAQTTSIFVPSLSPQFITSDARPIIIKNYLHLFRSPLETHSRLIVQISDKYSLDYRLLVAIAQQESNLCKKIPPGSYNCWGYGIYGKQTIRFDGYPQALETVARALKKDYIDQGLTTPEKIMAKYTPPSIEAGGSWAKGVSQFLLDLE